MPMPTNIELATIPTQDKAAQLDSPQVVVPTHIQRLLEMSNSTQPTISLERIGIRH
jgi:hypothetical protein